MASIEHDITQIRKAVYGEDVREAIADGISQINTTAQGAVQIRNELKGDFINLQNEVRTDVANMRSSVGNKVSKPTSSPNGTDGQVLKTDGRGGTRWENLETPTQAQIATAVENWMDDHPEASTTIQDGAVTFAKLGVDLNRAQIVKNIAELRETTADYVYVLENDSKVSDINTQYGTNGRYSSDEPFSPDRGGCWFWKHSNNTGGTTNIEVYGGYERTNGDVMFAMPDQGSRASNSNEALSALFDVFASYYNRNNFTYGRQKTLFMEDCTATDGKFEIDCASLLSAVIQGINYESSRYVRGTNASNIFHSTGIKLPSTRGQNCLYLNELVEYFAERKCLFTIQSYGATTSEPSMEVAQKNGIMPGDILFHSTDGASESYRWTQYYTVSHAVLVLAVYPEEGNILIAEAGGTNTGKMLQSILQDEKFGWIDNIKNTDTPVDYTTLRTVKISLINFSKYAGSIYKVFARPSYLTGRASNNISGQFIDYGVVATDSVNQWKPVGRILPSIQLKPGRVYSLTVKGTLPQYVTDNEYLSLYVEYLAEGASSVSYANVHPWMMCNGDGRTMSTVFCVPYDTPMEEIVSIIIRVRSRSTTYGHPYHIEEAALYNGVSFGSEGSRAFVFTQASTFPNNIENRSYECGDKIVIDLSFKATGTANEMIPIGAFEYRPDKRTTVSLVIPGSLARLHAASLLIDSNGNASYGTNSTSTGTVTFRAII